MKSTQNISLKIHHCLQQAQKLLNSRLETELLLAHVLQVSRTHLLAWPDQILTPEQQQQFQQLLQRRLQGESIAHIVGEKEFWSLTLTVSPDTLIPRPETELLVETALEKLPANILQNIADLGTGSGAIALALAKERPHWQITATDIDSAALKIAQYNAKKLALKNITFHQGNWFKALPANRQFHAIISNPPYIAENDPHLDPASLAFEPKHALISDNNGLHDLYLIIAQAKKISH